MTFRERQNATYRKEPRDRILWQPRLEHWYATNKAQGTLPERYANMSLLEVYDDLNCSVRAYHLFNPALRIIQGDDFRTETIEEPDRITTIWHTSKGDLRSVELRTALAWHRYEMQVKTPDDMRIMEHILRSQRVEFDWELFRRNDELLGDRGAPTMYLPRVNIQRLYIDLMGFEPTLLALHDWPDAVERLIRVIDETDEEILRVVAECPVEHINFGDNVDCDMLPPPLLVKYVMPAYQRRNEVLHAAGKFTHTHFDGKLKTLLPYLRDLGCDGFEALTPLPQGDVSLQEIKDALGDDLLLLDGIPCTDFMPDFPYEELRKRTLEILDLFAPNLILGVSDEPSPPADIEKIRFVSEIVEGYVL
jgi:hypothetical protein